MPKTIQHFSIALLTKIWRNLSITATHETVNKWLLQGGDCYGEVKY